MGNWSEPQFVVKYLLFTFMIKCISSLDTQITGDSHHEIKHSSESLLAALASRASNADKQLELLNDIIFTESVNKFGMDTKHLTHSLKRLQILMSRYQQRVEAIKD